MCIYTHALYPLLGMVKWLPRQPKYAGPVSTHFRREKNTQRLDVAAAAAAAARRRDGCMFTVPGMAGGASAVDTSLRTIASGPNWGF